MKFHQCFRLQLGIWSESVIGIRKIYILFFLGVIPLDRHLVNQASFGNQFQTSIQEKSKRYHKKKIKKIPQNAQNDKLELVEY